MVITRVEYFIGGGGDKGDWISGITAPTGIMKAVADRRRNTSVDILCLYQGHEEEADILKEIITKWRSGSYTSIRITGHSWGGQAAMDLAQDLFNSRVPLEELITLDPVSTWPFGKVYAAKWVNVYTHQSFTDLTSGQLPIVGNIVNAVITAPTLLTSAGREGDYIANVGRQLGSQN